ncbi:conserved hypothetical protein [delta proteobacterium NaphS2]|nr:conserved hypothetical protein [delta proteobacterium NaphS2]
MRKFMIGVSLFLLLATVAVPAAALESMALPTGVLLYNPDKTYEGYTLIPPTGVKTCYLINMEGDVVHSWDLEYPPGLHGQLLENGNLLIAGVVTPKINQIGGHGGIVQEYTWDGKKVWEYKLYSKDMVQHHTFFRMPNGNTLILGWEAKSRDEGIAKGRNPNTVPKVVKYHGKDHTRFWVDFIREVNRNGETVWEWHAWDHIGTGYDKLDINYKLPEGVGGLYPNFDWTHFNTVGYIPETDQIILNSRNFAEFYLINHKTGKIEYRWGNPTAWDPKAKKPGWYDNGDQIVWGSHHANYIGNNHITIFDNGSSRATGPRSSAVEVDLKTGDIVWQYTSNNDSNFYSFRQGAVQRLANGNTLITSTDEGHIFEVTKDKEVVWDFVNPILFASKKKYTCVLTDREEAFKALGHDFMKNMVHRAYRYGKGYPAFKGRDLSVKRELAEGCPKFFKVYKMGAKLEVKAPEAAAESDSGDGPQMMHAY